MTWGIDEGEGEAQGDHNPPHQKFDPKLRSAPSPCKRKTRIGKLIFFFYVLHVASFAHLLPKKKKKSTSKKQKNYSLQFVHDYGFVGPPRFSR